VPINRTPPEILSLIPHFWESYSRDQDVIALTHVCQAWRDLFVSCPSLWTKLDCVDLDRTRVYLERSKSSPIDLSLDSDHCTSLSDPFFNFLPHVAGRLKSLHIEGGSKHLQPISAYLLRPAPLLEELRIRSYNDPVLPSTFLNEDLSSLRLLYLEEVRTELPWRNMVNLTSFTLIHESPISASQYLDFFESAPHLQHVSLSAEIPITDVQNGRLVPMTCLKRMNCGGCSASHLFDHLLIPVGARLQMRVDLPNPTEGRTLKFIDNLKNLPNFTTIGLDTDMTSMWFRGPNGEVRMTPSAFDTSSMLGYLAYFDTSMTEWLWIKGGKSPNSTLPYSALLPMKGLRTLTLTRCEDPHIFVHALHPGTSSSGVVVCPELEELVIEHKAAFDLKVIEGVVAARASRGAKLKLIRIISWYGTIEDQIDASELKNLVSRVETALKIQPPFPGPGEWVHVFS